MTITARILVGCLLAAAIIGKPGGATAQDDKPPQLIQEAFLGSLAYMQDRGEIQIGSLMRADGSSANRTASIPFAFEYGITDNIEVGFETGGLNYERAAAGWSSPADFEMGLRYGRYGLLPNLHAAVSIGVESEGAVGGRTTNATSGLQLGVDIPRLRMTHIFTNAIGGVWNSEGIGTRLSWGAGVVVPFGHLRAIIERPLRIDDAANRGTVPGLVWTVREGLEIGAATTLRTQTSTRLSGAMLSLVLEF